MSDPILRREREKGPSSFPSATASQWKKNWWSFFYGGKRNFLLLHQKKRTAFRGSTFFFAPKFGGGKRLPSPCKEEGEREYSLLEEAPKRRASSLLFPLGPLKGRKITGFGTGDSIKRG